MQAETNTINEQAISRTVPSTRALRLRERLQPLLDRLAAQPETAGVCVLGSFALGGIRPHADIHSDFDIALFIDIPVEAQLLKLDAVAFQAAIQKQLPDWLPNFKFVCPADIVDDEPGIPPLQINVHQLVLAYVQQPDNIWPPDRREAFANTCDIVFDPTGSIAELARTKSQPPIEEIRLRINRNLALIPITIEHSVEKAAYRGLIADSHLALAETIDCLIDLAYALDFKDIPYRKWRVKQLSRLSYLSEDFQSILETIITTPAFDVAQMQLRINKLKTLFEQLRQRSAQIEGCLADPYRQLVAEIRPGFQLRHQSEADHSANPALDQYGKMQDETWNQANFELRTTRQAQ